jgi:alkanesulfonate monooxygenase SsuD/methylene tetrahydromethanopterin reductase-like flavin-dependent oxidoreductase (luciferase family)
VNRLLLSMAGSPDALFGVTFMLDPPASRVVEWAKLAEDQGFDHVWAWDSHVLWQDIYPVFALIAADTRRVKIGPCVTNRPRVTTVTRARSRR